MRKIIVSNASEANAIKRELDTILKLFADNKNLRVNNHDTLLKNLRSLRQDIRIVGTKDDGVKLIADLFPERRK